MAKTLKKTQEKHDKRWWKRVHQVVQVDLFRSFAVASILLNVLFLICIFVFTGTDTFDSSFYNYSRDKYCENVKAVEDRAKELNDEQKALDEWRVTCVSKEFQPFYQEAVEKFNARQNK